MAPAVTTAELNGSTTVLLAALKRCYEHLLEENLVQAIAKLKWAQQYGPHGDRTDPFEPDGEPLRFSNTREHWLWALGFNNAGVYLGGVIPFLLRNFRTAPSTTPSSLAT